MIAAPSRLALKHLEFPGAPAEACVRAVAADVLQEAGIVEPPVNLRRVASWLDLRVSEVASLSAAGCLIPADDGCEIQVRATDAVARQRFTIGHECGHTFHDGFALTTRHRCDPSSQRRSSGMDLEGLCDVAASELLLPRSLFEPDATNTGFSRESLLWLADRYQASITATAIKMVDTSPHPAALLEFGLNRSNADPTPKLRLRWCHTAGQWPYLPHNKSAGADDPFDLAHQGDIVYQPKADLSHLAGGPFTAEVHAWRADYHQAGKPTTRVLASLRRPQELIL